MRLGLHRGVGADVRRGGEKEIGKILAKVLPEDLLKFGLIPEFIGRLPVIGAVDNLAQALASLSVAPKSFISWFGRREAALPDLEYRTCATATREDAKIAAERMIGRRETFMSHVA